MLAQVAMNAGRERLSTAFFLDADYDCVVDPADIPLTCALRLLLAVSILWTSHLCKFVVIPAVQARAGHSRWLCRQPFDRQACLHRLGFARPCSETAACRT